MDSKKPVSVTISNRTILRVIALILAAYISIKLIVRVDHVLELIFISLFLSIALNPAVSWLAHNFKLKSRVAATGLAYLIVVIILVGFFALVLPPLIKQTTTFVNHLPQDIKSLKNPDSTAGKLVKHYHLTSEVNNLSQNISNNIHNFHVPVWSTASRISGILASIILVFVLTFMMIIEGPIWLNRYWRLRVQKKDWHKDLAIRMYKIVTGYVNGQVILALLGGAFALISLFIVSSILNVSVNEVALAAIFIFTGLIPMIGHIIGAVLVVIFCAFVSWPLALIMGIILIIYIQLASMTFQPIIQAKFNELSPLLVLIAAILGASAAGLLGAFIAIPLAGCIKIALKEYMVHKKYIN